MTTPAQIALPDANDFLVPEPPGGQWRTATHEEYLEAFWSDRPTAYVEWSLDSTNGVMAYFVVDGQPASGGGT